MSRRGAACRSPGAMLRAYDKRTGQEVGAGADAGGAAWLAHEPAWSTAGSTSSSV